MKLLVINWQDWKNSLGGGAEVYLYEIFSRILKKGHEITLLVSRPEGSPRYENLEGFEVYRIGRRNNFNFVVPAAVRSLLRHHQYDLIVDDLNKIPFYTPAFIKKRHFGLMMHLFRKDIYKEVGFIRATYVLLTETLISLFYRNTPFAVLSESSKQDLIKLGLKDKNISIVYCGIDRNKFKLAEGRKKFGTILYMGRLKRYKSVHHLIKGIPILLKRRKDFKVIIAGDGDARAELVSLVKSENIQPWVEFKYDVSEEEKVALYQQAWLLVQPSVKEGWGLTVIEAGACGTPSIAARSPGLIESVKDGETGILYPYGDIRRMVDGIDRLLTDQKKWREFSRAAIKWADQFSWEKSAAILESILKEYAR